MSPLASGPAGKKVREKKAGKKAIDTGRRRKKGKKMRSSAPYHICIAVGPGRQAFLSRWQRQLRVSRYDSPIAMGKSYAKTAHNEEEEEDKKNKDKR